MIILETNGGTAMRFTFETLCKELNLTSELTQTSQLTALEHWCNEHISQEERVTGDEHLKYRVYLDLASNYLDKFLAYLPADLHQRVPQFGDLNVIQYAAEQGYDRFITAQDGLSENLLNEGDRYGMTPLHKSAVHGYPFSVQALLNKGADAQKLNARKQYPIHSALFVPMLYEDGLIQRKETIFRALLPHSPQALTAQDQDGNTVLHQMALHGFDKLMKEVLKTNPQLAFICNNASHYPIHTAILNHQQTIIPLLLPIKGVSVLGDAQERVPLHYAARYGTDEIVQACCQATPDINIRDSEAKTPLLWAAAADNPDALMILIQNGADPSLSDYQGFSILHYAVNEQNESLVRWITHNTSKDLIKQIDNQGHSPLFYANKLNNKTIETILLN